MRDTGATATGTIEHAAAKGEFLTLDELAAWAQDGMRAGVDGNTVVRVVASMSGKSQKALFGFIFIGNQLHAHQRLISEALAIEENKHALFASGLASREVYRIAGAASPDEARDKAIEAWTQGPGEPRERR